MDKELFEIQSFVHGGVETFVTVEETPRLRRICVTRYRKIFGEPKKVGEVHIYVDEVDSYILALRRAVGVMDAIGAGGVGAGRNAVKVQESRVAAGEGFPEFGASREESASG